MDDKIYSHLCNFVKKMGHEVIFDKKTITIKDKFFKSFNRELKGFIGTNPYKYFKGFNFIFYTHLKTSLNSDKSLIDNYCDKTIVKINNSGQIETINYESWSLYHPMTGVEKKYFYDYEGFIMEHSIETKTGYFTRFDFNTDKNGNYLQIFVDDTLKINNDNKSETELKSYTKFINDLIYISDLDILFLEKSSSDEKD